MDQTLQSAIADRRSVYGLGKEEILTDESIAELISHAVKHAPTAFNSQSARVLVLLKDEHDKFWSITKDILRGIVPENSFAATEEKIDSFQNAYGTILYFEDQDTVKGLQEQFPLYQENFPIWSLQSSGMLQYSIWMLLESAGYGANLQHYNPLVDEKVKEIWNIPNSWKLLAEMPFGKPLAPPDEKAFLPIEERVLVSK